MENIDNSKKDEIIIDKGFIVVYEYTALAKGYEGVRTWTSYENEKDFNKRYTEERAKKEKVIAKGITSDEAIKLTRETPLENRLNSALERSKNPENGTINHDILDFELANIILAEYFADREYDKK